MIARNRERRVLLFLKIISHRIMYGHRCIISHTKQTIPRTFRLYAHDDKRFRCIIIVIMFIISQTTIDEYFFLFLFRSWPRVVHCSRLWFFFPNDLKLAFFLPSSQRTKTDGNTTYLYTGRAPSSFFNRASAWNSLFSRTQNIARSAIARSSATDSFLLLYAKIDAHCSAPNFLRRCSRWGDNSPVNALRNRSRVLAACTEF